MPSRTPLHDNWPSTNGPSNTPQTPSFPRSIQTPVSESTTILEDRGRRLTGLLLSVGEDAADEVGMSVGQHSHQPA